MLEMSVPKVDQVNSVADGLLLVEYLRRQWIKYRIVFGDHVKWTNFCRLMGSSSSSENRFAKSLRRAASVIPTAVEVQEIFRRPFAVEMRDLKDKLQRLEKRGVSIEAFTVEKTLEAVEVLKSWRIRTVSILELMSKLSDFCECVRNSPTRLAPERQNELLATFVAGLRTQVDPLQDAELAATFEDYVTRRFHFDASSGTFDGGWTLNMFSAALSYFVGMLGQQVAAQTYAQGQEQNATAESAGGGRWNTGPRGMEVKGCGIRVVSESMGWMIK
ncbi:hypothetical protein M427DRAFT_365468 [Gonapodya prolifera JEL478]|uniref:Uncharacterized protein n=1 Tax=Gonapodya prolifera (strain JEL478) TaxID=1344416 RepID=A0A139AAF0_GONPJ|nr:hypothetical protein M427DRAFT_365468 [Gonapodya prolifera JEL478]|eukprot:KXS13634.1 hypothetical protein M427DRAFT_365468 [Gonapodya prolifera JEL478]